MWNRFDCAVRLTEIAAYCAIKHLQHEIHAIPRERTIKTLISRLISFGGSRSGMATNSLGQLVTDECMPSLHFHPCHRCGY